MVLIGAGTAVLLIAEIYRADGISGSLISV